MGLSGSVRGRGVTHVSTAIHGADFGECLLAGVDGDLALLIAAVASGMYYLAGFCINFKTTAAILGQKPIMKHHSFTWRTRILSLFRLVLIISGCAAVLDGRALAQTWSTTDLSSNKPLPSGTYGTGSAMVQWQVGNYLSDGLQIYGLLCIPPSSLSAPYPVAILNHGTCFTSACGVGNPPKYPGIQSGGMAGCLAMAKAGWLTAISTYRGGYIDKNTLPSPYTNDFYPSGGLLADPVSGDNELCKGTVDDVLNLLSAVMATAKGKANQVFMWGHSHGSCITERAIERGAAVQVAVSIDGPTDFATWALSPPILNADKVSRSSALNNPAADDR